MTNRCSTWRGAFTRTLVFAVSVALLPLPAAAGDPVKPAKAPGLQDAMSKIVAKDVAAMKPPKAGARRAEQATPGTESPAFFKTPAGIVILAVTAVGAGYAIYSTQNDRIHSAGKQ